MLIYRKNLFFVTLFFFYSIINSCSPTDNNYYVINKVRVVAAVFQNSALVSGSSFAGTSTQQFPVRLTSSTNSCSSTHFYLVAISPTSEVPTLTINSITAFAIGNNYLSNGGGARGTSAGTSGTSVASSSFFNSSTTTTVQTSPFRLTIFDFPVNCANLTTTNLNSYMSQAKDIPGFQISYTVSSSSSSDNGFYSFYFLPEPTDTWWTSTTFPTNADSNKVTQIKNGLAVTNNPLLITSISPASNSLVSGSNVNLNINLNSPTVPSPRDPNNSLYTPSSRVQWYVSTGSINLDTASSTTWNPGVGSGNTVGGLVVVRDLLGGVDLKILGPFTTQ
ncbi:hypothetical protein QEJ31_15580 [Pigmentibacter sp. JX0631]|uniref:hypothetical protein n=1 Tax=Pigmentibacter sp. JX0631 TaxID=2976982 RepID=UPI002468C620|nr:hypothetical protein [Pigmentibacter sp. JX0631]WGL59953.1 hypothetical protein QEJ31_15580 [Pigmentibacter sp. JX0631]